MGRIIYGNLSENGTMLKTYNLEEDGIITEGNEIVLRVLDYMVITNNVIINGVGYSKIELLNKHIMLGSGTKSQTPPCQSMVLTKDNDGEFTYVELIIT